MDRLRRTLSSIHEQLRHLNWTQQAVVGLVVVVLLMTFFLVVAYSGGERMVPLLPTSASPEEQQQAAEHLQLVGMTNQTQNGRLLVPESSYHAALASLESSGHSLGDTGQLYFDKIFEGNGGLFRSNRLQDQMYRTALQNELAITLSNFPDMSRASVFIAQPTRVGIGDPLMVPSASVNVVPRTNVKRIPQQTIDAIADHVAGAVAGMDPRNVRISDGRRSYRASDPDSLTGSSYLDQMAKSELHYRRKIQEMLDYIIGLRVAVSVVVDPSAEQTTKRSFLPKGEGSESLLSTSEGEELSQASAVRGAEPGVAANTEMSINTGQGGGNQLSETKERQSFENFPGVEERVAAETPGRPAQVNASIDIPIEYIEQIARRSKPEGELTDADIQSAFTAEQARIRDAVSPLLETITLEGTAIAGTAVTVSMIPVPTGVGAQEQAGLGSGIMGMLTGSPGGTGTLAKNVVIGALALVSLVMVLMVARKATRARELPSAEDLVGIPPALEHDDEIYGEAEESDSAMDAVEVDEETIKTNKMLKEIGEMVGKNPEVASSLFAKWVAPQD